MDEQAYEQGRKQAYVRMLRVCLRELGGVGDDPERRVAALLMERQEAVAALREICGAFGDNDWPDDLHLGDVIEKHLARWIFDRQRLFNFEWISPEERLPDDYVFVLVLRTLADEFAPAIGYRSEKEPWVIHISNGLLPEERIIGWYPIPDELDGD